MRYGRRDPCFEGWTSGIAEPSPAAAGALTPFSIKRMRLRLSNPELVPELVEFLESRADMVTARVGEDEIEVSLLGSYGTEQAWLTLGLLVRAWEAGRSADASVELLR